MYGYQACNTYSVNGTAALKPTPYLRVIDGGCGYTTAPAPRSRRDVPARQCIVKERRSAPRMDARKQIGGLLAMLAVTLVVAGAWFATSFIG